MKKFLLAVALIATVGAISCTKEEVPTVDREGENNDGKLVTLTVGVSSAETRGTSASSDESTVSDLQVFVFDSSGNYERSGSASGSSVTISCFTGSKKVAALVNAPAVTSPISSLSDLEKQSSNLSDNSLSKFVMYGEKECTVTDGGSVTIDVDRLVARVVLEKVIGDLDDSYAGDVTITGVYLINVAGDTAFGGGSPSVWYNKFQNDGDMTDFLYDQVSNVTTTTGSPYTTAHYFYCYPNPTSTDSFSTTWSARFTRLVVEATINGNTWYYPITLDGVQSNYSYEVTELTITGPGATAPDSEIQKGSFTFKVSVNSWTTKDLGSKEI